MIHAYGAQSSPTWGLDRIDQRNLPLDASYSFSSIGNGVTAYIIDTGIRTAHTEFGGRAFVGFDAFGGNGQDCNGHGTHVAGTVGGTNYGVAKNTRLIAIRVLDCNGSGTTSGVIAGIDWVTKNRILPAVANLSLGGGTSTALDTALQNMIFSGVATAVAAGNSGADACKYSPARVPAAMTIGASNSSDAKASWSNYGKCVDWFAPGVSITSAWYSSNSATNTISGTSMATPHVAGAAALYLETHPTDTPAQVRDALLSFTTKSKITSALSTNNHLLHIIEQTNGTGDYSSPSVIMSSPLDGSSQARRTAITLAATATDNTAISKVEFYANGTLLCTDTSAPYSCAWTTPNFVGTYRLQSIAYDAAGNTGSSGFVTITVK
jgi:subtilisin family serine protease